MWGWINGRDSQVGFLAAEEYHRGREWSGVCRARYLGVVYSDVKSSLYLAGSDVLLVKVIRSAVRVTT